MAKTRAKNATPPDLTLEKILTYFRTDEDAREYLEAVRWPDGPVCPHCGCTDKIYPIKANPKAKVRPGLYECGDCKGQFRVEVGTIFEKSKVPLRKWLVAWYLLCSSKKGFSALQLQRALELGSYRTAWFMMHRIRYALRDPAFSDKLGGQGGTVESDETWIGGKRKGRGSGYTGNKAVVVSLVERGGNVRSTPIAKVTGKNLDRVLSANVDPDAVLMTDESPNYKGIGPKFREHHTVNHRDGEYVRGDVTTNTVEGYFANLKRGLDGVYHHVGSHYLSQYLGEFDFRYNTRKLTDGHRTRIGLAKVEGKRLKLRRASN